MQQGVENFFATQRILVDLAMRQNGTVIDVMREKLTAPDFRPVAVVKEFAGEGLANFIEGQKLILGLAQQESEILATGVKERVGGFAVTDALVDTIRRSVDTFVEMQLEYLKSASKQVHGRLAAVKAGESMTATRWSNWPAMGWKISCRRRRSSCMSVAEEAPKLTSGKEMTVSKAKKTELTEAGAGGGRFLHRSPEEADGRGGAADPCQPEDSRDCREDDAGSSLPGHSGPDSRGLPELCRSGEGRDRVRDQASGTEEEPGKALRHVKRPRAAETDASFRSTPRERAATLGAPRFGIRW